jgi:hypothetical protein
MGEIIVIETEEIAVALIVMMIVKKKPNAIIVMVGVIMLKIALNQRTKENAIHVGSLDIKLRIVLKEDKLINFALIVEDRVVEAEVDHQEEDILVVVLQGVIQEVEAELRLEEDIQEAEVILLIFVHALLVAILLFVLIIVIVMLLRPLINQLHPQVSLLQLSQRLFPLRTKINSKPKVSD